VQSRVDCTRHHMEQQDAQLSPGLIRSFVYGGGVLRPDQFQHLRDCDQCSDAWWRLKQEAKRERRNDDAKKKTA